MHAWWWLGLLVTVAFAAQSASAITITEFSASVLETGGMVRAPNGDVWVATAGGLTRMAPDGTVAASHGTPAASNLALGPDGALWFSQPASTGTGTSLGRLTTGGSYSEWPIATPLATINGIAAGADGNLWLSQVAGSVRRIARISPVSGVVTEFPGPTVDPGAIALGPDGNIWFAQGSGKVGRILSTGLVTEMPLDGAASRLAFAPGSAVGFYASAGKVGRITPASGGGTAATVAFTQGLTPNADVQGIAIGADGNGWFTETVDGRIGRIKPSGQIDEFTTGIVLRGQPHAITAGPGATLWFSDTFNGRIGRVVLDPPQALTGEATALSTSGATLSAAVLPRGAATTAHFEWGRTTAYGQSTPLHDVGDGDVSSLVTAPVGGMEAGATYHYRIVASSPVGTSVGIDRVLTTVPLPPTFEPPFVPPPAPDADGDGYPDSVDCGAGDPVIHPGAPEVPGNAVDEDCANGAEPFARFFPRTDVTYDNHGRRYSVFTRMVISDVPAGAGLKLTCRGRGCAFKTWSSGTLKRSAKRLNLLEHLKRSRLRPHAVLELRLMRPGQIATIVRWTIGPPPRPSVTCLYPDKKKAQKCPR